MMLRLRTNRLKPGLVLAKTIYDDDYHILLKQGVTIKSNHIRKLKEHQIPSVFIIPNKNFIELAPREIILDRTRIFALKKLEEILHLIKQNNVVDIPDVDELYNTVNAIIKTIAKKRKLNIHFTDIRTQNKYIFAHMVNVCIIALIIGQAYGLPTKELQLLGIGAILHDLGKLYIPKHILNKPGKLTNQEFDQVKRHPTYGFNILDNIDIMDNSSKLVALQHHEQCNGMGYPQGLKEDEIHEYAQITSIADCFDALTTDRSYRPFMHIKEAVKIMVEERGTKFSAIFLDLLLSRIPFLPTGTPVEFADGKKGVVLYYRGEKPVISLVDKKELPETSFVNMGRSSEHNAYFLVGEQ